MAAKKAVKKAAKKPAKKVAKKSTAKKATAKKAVKKAAVKKTAKRTTKKASASYKVPPVPTRSVSRTTKRISSEPAEAKVSTPAPAAKSQPNKPKSSSRTVVTILAAVVLIALLVVSRNSSKNSTDNSATPAASTSQSAAPATSAAAPAASTSSGSATTAAPAAPSAGHGAPQGIVAHYTANGATIFWAAPSETSGISNYQVEISTNGGAFKVASTVPSSQLSYDIKKSGDAGWSSFRISTVYSDGTVVGGKVFGLPAQWN